jgi:hypothetical protein
MLKPIINSAKKAWRGEEKLWVVYFIYSTGSLALVFIFSGLVTIIASFIAGKDVASSIYAITFYNINIAIIFLLNAYLNWQASKNYQGNFIFQAFGFIQAAGCLIIGIQFLARIIFITR